MFEYGLIQNEQLAEIQVFPIALNPADIKMIAGKYVLRPIVRVNQDAVTIPGIQTLVEQAPVVETTRVVINYVVQYNDINQVKEQLKLKIDERAEQERLKFITPGFGQTAVYLEKAKQAQECAAANGAGIFPLIESEIGITGSTMMEVAGVILQMRDAWVMIAAQLETIRLGTKKLIDEAPTPDLVYSAFTSANWDIVVPT